MRFRSLLAVVLGVGVPAAVFSLYLSGTQASRLNIPAGPARAFLKAEWGMSKDEVQKANGLPLEAAPSSERYYQAPAGAEGRYETWQAAGQRFLGRPAAVYYTFRDGRLFTFHVFVTDVDGEALESDMRRYLVGKFGVNYSQEDTPPLKWLWQFKDYTVNYWFYEQDLSLVGRFKAGYGVLYRPLESAGAVDS